MIAHFRFSSFSTSDSNLVFFYLSTVIRCKDLQRASGGDIINAYVKVALLPNETNAFQRTVVHRDSNRPFFDHRFIFDLTPADQQTKRIMLAVWHRDREYK